MRWLKSRPEGDEGLSLVLIAVMLVLLLGFVGLAVDLGALYMERRELRNSADAAVLAIAEDCALGATACDAATAGTTAQGYVDANSDDGSSYIDQLDLDVNSKTVRVITAARDAETGELGREVPFMGLFGFDRVQVRAPATAIWGFPSTGEGIPIAIEECEFYKAGGWDSGTTVTLTYHQGVAPEGEEEETCAIGPAGQDAPGGFGWLDSPEENCAAYIIFGSWENGASTGGGAGQAPPGTGCDGETIRELIYQKKIPIPVFSDVRDGGANIEYYMEGLAFFFVDAYKLGNRPAMAMPNGFDCPGSSPSEDVVCLQGHFTSGTLSYGETGGENYGAVIVKLVE
jgi:hypothetical protein